MSVVSERLCRLETRMPDWVEMDGDLLGARPDDVVEHITERRFAVYEVGISEQDCLTFHESLAAAEAYLSGQEYPEDWTVEWVLDLDTGEVYDSLVTVTLDPRPPARWPAPPNDDETVDIATSQTFYGGPTWTDYNDESASHLGWGIFECGGSRSGPWQIQAFDVPDEHVSGQIIWQCQHCNWTHGARYDAAVDRPCPRCQMPVGVRSNPDGAVWCHLWTYRGVHPLYRLALDFIKHHNRIEYEAIERFVKEHPIE